MPVSYTHLYMVTELGTAPYDAIPFLSVKAQKKVPFRVVRMVFDFTVIVIAWVFGAKIGLVTILMGFTLGPDVYKRQHQARPHSLLAAGKEQSLQSDP